MNVPRLNGGQLAVKFHNIRNISSPEDLENDRTVYTGHLPIESVVNFTTNDNVRGYLVEADGKQRRTKTQVHRAIEDTLKERPHCFSVLNGGIVIVAKSSQIDEKNKTLTLEDSSIINGAQTQGIIKDFLANLNEPPTVHIKFELIVSNDEDLVADISISRNFQNDVRNLSIAGRKGQLDDLENQIKEKYPHRSLQKSESQIPTDDNNYIQTEKLLQVIAALLPEKLWWKKTEFNKVYTYSAKATCLKDFQHIYLQANDERVPQFEEVYQFYLDIAPQAWDLYEKWKRNQNFSGTGLRSIERDGREIVDVPDGIIFPILASLANFAKKHGGSWKIKIPSNLSDLELITAAKRAYQEIAKHKPEIMGKTKACYSQLDQITSIYEKLAG